MESNGGSAVAVRTKWTRSLEKYLIETAKEVDPFRRGYIDRIIEKWRTGQPTYPPSRSAIVQKLYKLRKRRNLGQDLSPKDPDMPEEMEWEWGETPSPSEQGNPVARPETDHAPDSDEPVTDSCPDPERCNLDGDTPQVEPQPLAEEHQCKLEAGWDEYVAPGPNSIVNRERQVARWGDKDPVLLDQIDKAMADLWIARGETTLWSINSLIYSGAKLATEAMKCPRDDDKAAENMVTDLSDPSEAAVQQPYEEDYEPDFEDDLPQREPAEDDISEPTSNEVEGGQPDPKAKYSINQLRKLVSWLVVEKAILRKGGRQPVKGKRKRRYAVIKRWLRGSPYNLRGLKMLEQSIRGLLRIKTLQQRRAKQAKARKQAMKRLAQHGPKSLVAKSRREPVQPKKVNAIAKFWKSVWEVEGCYNLSHPAIKGWENEMRVKVGPGVDDEIPDKEKAWLAALSKVRSWTAPGPDGIPGYWLKAFKRMRGFVKELLFKMLEGESDIPNWFVKGRTVLIPKEGSEGQPDQFRPITCLNTMYKLFTGTMAAIIMDHVKEKGLLPSEQKALRKGQRGCLDAHTIDASIIHEAKVARRSLSVGWVDYRKAFDMIPHKWVKSMLKTLRVPRNVRQIIRKLMPKWSTNLEIATTKGKVEVPVTFRRGLFQGDSLSPLIFCLSIAPLSSELRKQRGFKSIMQPKPVSHLLFMDDLKVYSNSPENLEEVMAVVEDVSSAIGMTLGLKKCAVAHMTRGDVVEAGDTALPSGSVIGEVTQDTTYKYLGISQIFEADLKVTKERVRKEFVRRQRKVWGSKLNARGKAKVANTWATAVLRYYLPAIEWTRTEVKKLDRKIRHIMRQNGCHQYSAARQRVHMPRSEGGRGVQSVEEVWERETISGALYLERNEDEQVKGAVRFQKRMARENKLKYSLVGRARTVAQKLGIEQFVFPDGSDDLNPLRRQEIQAMIKAEQMERLRDQMVQKRLHGVFYNQMLHPSTDKKATTRWLCEGKLRAETEAIIIAAQDGVICTGVYRCKIQKKVESLICRKCGEKEESIGHILSSCQEYLWSLYKDRHDRVLYQLVKGVAEALKLTLPKWLRAPNGAVRGGVVGPPEKQLLIDQCIPTDKQMESRRPDLAVRLKAEKRWIIFEVACAWEPTVEKREKLKRNKYEPLAADLANQWPGYRVTVIPVVVGDLGLIAGRSLT